MKSNCSLVILTIILVITMCSYTPLKEIGAYEWEVDSIFPPKISEKDIKYYINAAQRTDTMYTKYLILNSERSKFFNNAFKLVQLSRESPYYKYDSLNNVFYLRGDCEHHESTIDENLLLWIQFVISYSGTYSMKGYGPTVTMKSNCKSDMKFSKIEVNYSQLVAALTWYRLNEKLLSPNAFLIFSGTRNGYG